jgi:hypothetical protein
MTINLKSLTMKNFLSVGAVTQTVDFNINGVTLVLGENLDLGGNGSRNGVGKCLRGSTQITVGFANPSVEDKFKKFLETRHNDSRGSVVPSERILSSKTDIDTFIQGVN